ncbi:MAG: hypothetical protein C0595_04365 [Marinilabiliales bacterium]|nr:MAG: hypothetical protein C0595_04365 [Marinilabiliales bacterium]
MIKNTIIFLFVFGILQISHAQESIENNAFKAGEELKYRVFYSSSLGNLTAGEAILKVEEWKESNSADNKSFFHITGIGNSKGFFDWFYKVRDRFETHIDQETLLPYMFVRRTREGKYKYDDDVFFDRENLLAKSRREIKPIPKDVHDIISALYYLRALSLDNFEQDSTYRLSFYLDDSLYHTTIKYISKGKMKTTWGWIDCLKFSPKVATGEVFSDEYPMAVWVTDDDNHLPIMAESKVVVGSIRMELIEYSGLKNKPAFFREKNKQE